MRQSSFSYFGMPSDYQLLLFAPQRLHDVIAIQRVICISSFSLHEGSIILTIDAHMWEPSLKCLSHKGLSDLTQISLSTHSLHSHMWLSSIFMPNLIPTPLKWSSHGICQVAAHGTGSGESVALFV